MQRTPYILNVHIITCASKQYLVIRSRSCIMETSIYYYYYYYFFLFIFTYLLSNYLVHVKRNRPPSPGLSLPLIGHLYILKKPFHRTLANLSNKYGPVLFIQFGSRRVVLVSSPSAAEECVTKNDLIFANRPRLPAGKLAGYNYTTLFWASYGHHWRNLRRMATKEVLSSNRLHMFYDLRANEVKSLICQLFRCSKDVEFATVNMKTMLFELALNVMMRMIAGKRYYGENIAELEEAQRFKEIVTETLELSGATNIGDFVSALKWVGFNMNDKRQVTLQRKRDEFTQNLVEEHRRMRMSHSGLEQKSKTLIDALLELQATDPQYYTDDIIKGMIQVFLSAGTDTTAGTLEWTLSVLLNNPETIVKAQNEIDINIAESKAKLIDESDLLNLPYLQCIINESMRMYPAGPLLAPHESSEECTIGGFTVPRGTMLMVNMWAIQNDPNIWEEPTKFNPERFQKPEMEKNQFTMLPFGYRRRRCPGEGLATRMVGMAVGCLIQCFEWKRVGEEMVDMSEGHGLTMRKLQPLLAKCRPRPTMVNFLSEL